MQQLSAWATSSFHETTPSPPTSYSSLPPPPSPNSRLPLLLPPSLNNNPLLTPLPPPTFSPLLPSPVTQQLYTQLIKTINKHREFGKIMERAKARAREFGKNLLSRARGGSDSSEAEMEDSKTATNRLSWSQVVARGSPEVIYLKENKETTAGKPRSAAGVAGKGLSTAGEADLGAQGGWSGKTKSPQRLFSAEDVAKLVEMARKQARKEVTASSGWQEIETKESKRKERTHIWEMVEDFRRSPEPEPKCW